MGVRRKLTGLCLSFVLGCSGAQQGGSDVPGSLDELGESGGEGFTSSKLVLGGDAVPDQYIVVLRDDLPGLMAQGIAPMAEQMLAAKGGSIRRSFQHALKGFSANMTREQAEALAADPRVEYVQENRIHRINAVQSGATWGIDRVDQRNLPLSGSYEYNADGTGANVYVIDTGIRMTHQQFGGRASFGFDSINDGQNGNDCQGHGTHVAGTIGSATYGVAKAARLYAVRVLNCQGSGTTEQVVAGIDWVTANHVKPAVANMSLGGELDQVLDDALEKSVQAGVVHVVAAGNDSADACQYSPARAPNAITVGSTTKTDGRSSFSNYGTCVDIFAPGSSILSSSNGSDTATATLSGTSMASPHVAGVAALYVGVNRTATPAQVAAALTSNATPDKVTNPGAGSPNKLVYMGFINGGGGGDTEAPSTSITSPANGASVSGTVTISATASDNVGVTRVEFLVDGAVIASDSAAPYEASWNSTSGNHALTTRAFDAAGNSGVSAAVNVTVAGAGGGMAAYDAALKAPRCTGAVASCDTGPELIKGRARLGPEQNAPNTLGSLCADGTYGRFHVDESVDAMKVATLDGAPFASGKRVRIDVSVWAYSTFSADTLEVYYASNANSASPTWILVGSAKPTKSGQQTLSLEYNLPATGGDVRAFRASFRYQGTASACTNGRYDDRDDLAFSVAP